MRKIPFNFQPTKSLPTFFAVLMILLLSACQKENLNDLAQLEESPTQEIIVDEDKIPTGDIELNLVFDPKTNIESANSRSATYLMYSGTFAVGQFNWRNFYYTRPQLPDPNVWRVEVTIRPLSGNPNLYIYGYDQDLVNPWRYIRSSTNPGMANDKTSYRETGMKGDEERLYMSIYGATNASFEIIIAAVTVDCEEYPTADQWVTLEYNPVCGCNGVEYPNPSSARVAGVTSWTVGACASINGLWTNTDADTRGITKMIISDNAQTLQLFGSCSPSDCDWGTTELTFDGTCYVATYEHGFATRYIKLHEGADRFIQMTIRHDYHDSRTDKTKIYYFR